MLPLRCEQSSECCTKGNLAQPISGPCQKGALTNRQTRPRHRRSLYPNATPRTYSENPEACKLKSRVALPARDRVSPRNNHVFADSLNYDDNLKAKNSLCGARVRQSRTGRSLLANRLKRLVDVVRQTAVVFALTTVNASQARDPAIEKNAINYCNRWSYAADSPPPPRFRHRECLPWTIVDPEPSGASAEVFSG